MASLEDLSPDAVNELAMLMRELSDNPQTREQVLRLTKQVRPTMPIGEIDLKDDFSAKMKAIQDRADALEGKLREKEALEDLERRRRNLLRKGKVRAEEEVAEVEKVMLEKGITDHETAADYWSYMKQAATPTPGSIVSRNVLNEQARSTLAPYWKNPQAAARDEAAKALNELRRPSRPIGI
jgi:hypothetical protein